MLYMYNAIKFYIYIILCFVLTRCLYINTSFLTIQLIHTYKSVFHFITKLLCYMEYKFALYIMFKWFAKRYFLIILSAISVVCSKVVHNLYSYAFSYCIKFHVCFLFKFNMCYVISVLIKL